VRRQSYHSSDFGLAKGAVEKYHTVVPSEFSANTLVNRASRYPHVTQTDSERPEDCEGGAADLALSIAKVGYIGTLVAVFLTASMFVTALIVGVQAVPATAGFGGAMQRGLEIITVVTQSTGLQGSLYFGLLAGGFIGGAIAHFVYSRSIELASHARRKLNQNSY
jgi:hypothetical protein